MLRRSLGLLTVLAAVASTSSTALAAPTTVNLRIEGKTRTLFEGSVTTDVRTFHFSDSTQTYQCDGTSPNFGPSPIPVPTRGGVFTQAEEQAPFAATGSFSAMYGNPSFDTIAGDNVGYDPSSGSYLVEYKNAVSAQVGACGDAVSTGDDVLFAYGDGSEQLLKLTAPSTAPPGQAVTLKITDAANGSPVAGATVEGRTSAADGSVAVGPYDARGDHDLKAAKPGAIRSNRARLCVTDGSDGACGTTTPAAECVTTGDDGRCGTADKRPPRGKITSVREGQRFPRGKGPRTLAGIVASDPSGIAKVALRLTRTATRHRCSTYDGTRERLTRTSHCGAKRGRWFAAGAGETWSYLLPARLPAGRYVLDVRASDRAGNVDTLLQRTRTRVVFTVR